MNEMAQQLGLTSAKFADPSGLDARNVASAYDISHLIAFASADAQLAPVMRKTSHEVRTSRRAVTVRSTNRLLTDGMDVVAVRTDARRFSSRAGPAAMRSDDRMRQARLRFGGPEREVVVRAAGGQQPRKLIGCRAPVA